MALPYTQSQELFSAAALTATTKLVTPLANAAGVVQIQVTTTGFSGTLDIQGKTHPSASYTNLTYFVPGAGSSTTAVAQLSYTTDTASYNYQVINPMPYMQVVMTRSAGSVSAWARGYSDPMDSALGSTVTVTPGSTAGVAPSNVTTTAYAASAVIKASAGTLYGFSGYNSKASAQFILLFNSATVPADTAQAVLVLTVPAASNFSYDPGIYGRRFTTGISWSNSSTSPLKTIGSADVFLDAQYV